MRNKGTAALLLAGGVLLAAITYAVLYLVVERGPVYEFMCGRGYYQHVSTALLFYGLLLVAHRRFEFKHELRSLQMDLPDFQIAPEAAANIAERIPKGYRDTIFGRRVAEALRARARSHQRPISQLQELWPNLECLVHSGMPLGPFADELRQVLGPAVKFHEIYTAAEGFIAAQDTESSRGLRLMADTGLFFEFLPMRDYDEARLAGLGAKAVPLEGVKPGVDYALLVTTPAGLCRYALGDVVRFLTTKPPRLIYVGRTRLQLRAFGENVSEKEITDVLTGVCARHGWQIVNFHAAPIFASSLTGQTRGRHEWWVELKPGTIETPTGPVLAAELDRAGRDLQFQRFLARRGAPHHAADLSLRDSELGRDDGLKRAANGAVFRIAAALGCLRGVDATQDLARAEAAQIVDPRGAANSISLWLASTTCRSRLSTSAMVGKAFRMRLSGGMASRISVWAWISSTAARLAEGKGNSCIGEPSYNTAGSSSEFGRTEEGQPLAVR